ncbi:MAG: hypothetical protein AMXMBFR56_81740 [Polyangiaceae bacterium]
MTRPRNGSGSVLARLARERLAKLSGPSSPGEAPAPDAAARRSRSGRTGATSGAAQAHPWSKPACRSKDRAIRTRVLAFYQTHVAVIEAAFGPPSLTVLVSLAQAADELELVLDPAFMVATDPGAEHKRTRALRQLAAGIGSGIRHAHRMAALEAKARRA